MNNKGFAITTILYGTLVLFLMLLVSMLGILSTYKDRLSMLIDKNNGARDIINAGYSEVISDSSSSSSYSSLPSISGGSISTPSISIPSSSSGIALPTVPSKSSAVSY